jgi:two-component system, NtrC family, nitrogen regulation sensor histidine kinase NtrY
VSLRRGFVLYLLFVHVLFAALAVPLFRGQRPWLLGLEVALAASLLTGLHLVRSLFGTLEVLREGAQLLAESDFTSRFRETSRPEMDDLIRVYNRMADHLREERVRTQEQHYFLSQILDVSPSGVVILDYDGRVEFANPAAERLLGRTRAEMKGVRPADLAGPLGEGLETLAAGESRVVPARGGRRVRVRYGTFLDRGFARSFLLLEELTDELRQFEKAAYEKLIRMMSHEVNNSVGAVSSLLNSSLALAGGLPAEERADLESALRVAIGRTEQLGVFMRGFAEVVRVPPPRLAPCDVRGLLEGVTRLLGPEADRRRVRWEWDAPAPLPALALDRIQMEQVFVNVIKNALEAIGADGVVTLRLGQRAARPFVTVEDSGPGLPPEARTNLFTPFFTTKENGQGLGLTLVREILDQHRFDYALESAPGGPTQFTIVF